MALLPERDRAAIASQIAYESGIEGIETAANIAIRDDSSEVKISVVEALDFRRADRFIVNVLHSAPDEVWCAVAQHGCLVGDADVETTERLVKERSRFIEAEIDPLRKLNAIVEAGRRGQVIGDTAAVLIESHDFPAMDQHVGWSLGEAYRVFPLRCRGPCLLGCERDYRFRPRQKTYYARKILGSMTDRSSPSLWMKTRRHHHSWFTRCSRASGHR